jgi:hypothetical protein
MDQLRAANELVDSLRELTGIARSIRELPAGHVLEASRRFGAWRIRFEACLPEWLAAVKALVPRAAATRAKHGRPPVERLSSAMEGLARLGEIVRDTLVDLDACNPLAQQSNCPRSLQKLRPEAWLELAGHRLGGRIRPWLDEMEGELRTEAALLQVPAGPGGDSRAGPGSGVPSAAAGADPQTDQRIVEASEKLRSLPAESTEAVEPVQAPPPVEDDRASFLDFTRKQQLLLKALWGQRNVAVQRVEAAIWPGKLPREPFDTLKKLMTRTNGELAAKNYNLQVCREGQTLKLDPVDDRRPTFPRRK